MNRKKVFKIIGNVIYGILLVSILFTTITVISTRASGGEPQLFGHQIKTVLSGSMEPTFKTGSIIVVKTIKAPKSLKVGDIITFKISPTSVVTHRITKINKSENALVYQTKGDNNKAADFEPVLSKNIVAQYTGFTIPYLGYLLTYSSTPIGTAVLLIIPGVLLLGYSLYSIRQALKEIETRTKNSTA